MAANTWKSDHIVTREMQIKATGECYLIATGTDKLGKKDNRDTDRECGTWVSHTLLETMRNAATIAEFLVFPYKIKHSSTLCPNNSLSQFGVTRLGRDGAW